jgi:hypothetical protein
MPFGMMTPFIYAAGYWLLATGKTMLHCFEMNADRGIFCQQRAAGSSSFLLSIYNYSK